MTTTPDAPVAPDREKLEGRRPHPNANHGDENVLSVKNESSHASESKLAGGSNGSPAASQELEPERTLRGFKVRTYGRCAS